MGAREDDYLVGIHRQPSMPGSLIVIRHHLGDVDHEVVVPPSSWGGLKTAANTSDAALFAALQEFAPSAFLVDLGSVATLRQAVIDAAAL